MKTTKGSFAKEDEALAIDRMRVEAGIYPDEDALYGPGGILEQIRSGWSEKERKQRLVGHSFDPLETQTVNDRQFHVPIKSVHG